MSAKFSCRHGFKKGKNLSVKDVDKKELTMGIAVEKEHTSSPRFACRIAMDHLAERPDYYTRLRAAGLDDEHPAPPTPAPAQVSPPVATVVVQPMAPTTVAAPAAPAAPPVKPRRKHRRTNA